MRLMFYALALYVGYRIAVENRRDNTPAGLLAAPEPGDTVSRPGAGAL